MNDLTPVPRSKQAPISIRSDKAAALLAQHTQNGRSQAEVIEEALASLPLEDAAARAKRMYAAIATIIQSGPGHSGLTFKEVDDAMWDEDGLPI